MKPTALLLLCFVFTANFCKGQNLVPNPSFEFYTSCPQSTYEINKATGWFSSSGSPDYFNTCANATAPYVGVPENLGGFQTPIEGNAYVGIVTFQTAPGVNYREVISVKLDEVLSLGVRYFVSMYVSRSDSDYDCATNNLGFRFTTSKFQAGINPIPIDDFSHVNELGLVTDKENWVKLGGSFVADSSYNYLHIGNFYSDINTDTFQCSTEENFPNYYFIDLVCVSIDSSSCLLAADIPLIDRTTYPSFIVSPNPTSDLLTIKGNQEARQVHLVNSLGNVVIQTEFQAQENILNVSGLENGMYLLYINNAQISKILIYH